MDVVEELLHAKDVPSVLTLKWWEKVAQPRILQAFLDRRGAHGDVIENFNSYIPEMLNMVTEHVVIRHVDDNNRLHRISIPQAWFVRPQREGVGLDTPEEAFIHHNCNYEAQVRGHVHYEIFECDDDEPDSETEDVPMDAADAKEAKERSDEKEDDEDDEDDEDGDEEEEEEEEEDGEEGDDDDDDDDAAVEIEDDEDDEDEKEEEEDEEDDEEKKADKSRSKPAVFRYNRINYNKWSIRVHESWYQDFLVLVMPVVLRTDLCHMSTGMCHPLLYDDPTMMGGNFVVSRTFKTCPCEEFFILNRVMPKKKTTLQVRCSFVEPSKRFRTNSTLNISMICGKEKKQKKFIGWHQTPRMMVIMPYETPKSSVTLMVMAMAFGWDPDTFVRAVVMFCPCEPTPAMESILSMMARDTDGCTNQRTAILRVGRALSHCRGWTDEDEIISYVSYTLRCEIMPNLIDPEDRDTDEQHERENVRKGYLLAQCAAHLVMMDDTVCRHMPEEDRWTPHNQRSYVYRRVDTPGLKMTQLLRKYMTHYVKKGVSKLRTIIDNSKQLDINSVLNVKLIKMTGSVRSGHWHPTTDTSETNQNKTQMVETGYLSDALYDPKIVRGSQKKGASSFPLLTDPTQAGRIDMYLTPESDNVGIMRNKAMGCVITPNTDLECVQASIDMVLRSIAEEVEWHPLRMSPMPRDYTRVFDVNGGLMGWTRHPFTIYKHFVRLRRKGVVYRYLEIEWNRRTGCLYFLAEEGRLVRPLVVMDRLATLVREVGSPHFPVDPRPVHSLLAKGVVEYVGANEEYCGLVFTADTLDNFMESGREHTHMEIHGIFSMCLLSCNAYCHMNQGARRLYTGNMRKRCISQKLYPDRGTTVSSSLVYGQDSNQSDPADQILGLRLDEPAYNNAIVAIAAADENIEDPYIINRGCIDRGMLTTREYHVISESIQNNHSEFARPRNDCECRAQVSHYHALNEGGIPRVGEILSGGDAVVGKIATQKSGSHVRKVCISHFLPWNTEPYRVQSVVVKPSEDAPNFVQVTLYHTHNPEAGDKFMFPHGQKGTIGRIHPPENMPWICEGPMAGVPVDVLINVCALSRTTQGMLAEMMMGKARLLDPVSMSQYDTVFLSKTSFQERLKLCSHILRQHGLKYDGKERMRLGTTGEEIECDIFVGAISMGVLKHMSASKLRARDDGPLDPLTRDPVSGQSRNGGQRLCEMSNHNLGSYGAAGVHNSYNFESSTKHLMFYCTRCQVPAIGNMETRYFMCTTCNEYEHIVRVNVAYKTNLVTQELGSVGLGQRLLVERVANPLNMDENAYCHHVTEIKDSDGD